MIVFVHWGTIPLYLLASLATARLSNPKARLVLISDNPKSMPKGFSRLFRIECEDISGYSQSAQHFKKLFRHQGFATYEYEFRCFARWFVLRDFVFASEWDDHFLCLDSDVLFFEALEKMPSYITTGMCVANVCGPAFSYFENSDTLQEYVDYISRTWMSPDEFRKVQELLTELALEGLPYMSDMATLASWSRKRNLIDLQELTTDHPFFCENPYESDFLGKGPVDFKVVGMSGRGGAKFVTSVGTSFRAGGLHLQGGSKRLWPKFASKLVLFSIFALKPRESLREIMGSIRYHSSLQTASGSNQVEPRHVDPLGDSSEVPNRNG